jgi:hypothetical protein
VLFQVDIFLAFMMHMKSTEFLVGDVCLSVCSHDSTGQSLDGFDGILCGREVIKD